MSAEIIHNPAGRSERWQSRNLIYGPIWGLLAAVPAAGWLWGFTVDDALITARVAAHLARGLGSRFNSYGPAVDAVTPLGYAWLLAPLGRGDTLATFRAAKWLGLLAWLASAGILGQRIAQVGQRALRFSPLAVVFVSVPLAAWSVSGMETGLVTLLVTLGLGSGSAGVLALGMAAAWRPELLPFACVFVAVTLRAERPPRAQTVLRLFLVTLPVALVALTRLNSFGRVVPLSFFAKPSDFAHGLRYALGAFAFTGLPWLLVATPAELARCSPRVWPSLAALLAHFCALVLCGGDWMALYRLLVPVLPCVALAAASIAERARPLPTCLRLGCALSSALLLAVGLGPEARRVGEERAALIAQAGPVLSRDARIAALDVGWVGAASKADVIDFAGVTDAQVAFFPGGHTSKRIPAAWLFAQNPSAIVLLLGRGAALETPFENSVFARQVEQHVAAIVAADFRVRTTLALGNQQYVVLEPNP